MVHGNEVLEIGQRNNWHKIKPSEITARVGGGVEKLHEMWRNI
jgi:hypothetical protein